MERYSHGPHDVTASITVRLDTSDSVTGMSERVNEKEEQNRDEEADIVSMCVTQEDTTISHLGFCKVSRGKVNST